MLTYDTTLQVITRTAQHDLLLHLRLLGRHFLVLVFPFTGVEARRKKRSGGTGREEGSSREGGREEEG